MKKPEFIRSEKVSYKICHFLVAILFTMMPCIILLEISCEDELPIFKRSLLNFSTRYDASSIVKQKGTVFQWHLPKWSMIESRNICMYFSSFEFPALIFTLHHFLKIRIIYVSTLSCSMICRMISYSRCRINLGKPFWHGIISD